MNESGELRVTCPSCRKRLRINTPIRRKPLKCPACSSSLPAEVHDQVKKVPRSAVARAKPETPSAVCGEKGKKQFNTHKSPLTEAQAKACDSLITRVSANFGSFYGAFDSLGGAYYNQGDHRCAIQDGYKTRQKNKPLSLKVNQSTVEVAKIGRQWAVLVNGGYGHLYDEIDVGSVVVSADGKMVGFIGRRRIAKWYQFFVPEWFVNINGAETGPFLDADWLNISPNGKRIAYWVKTSGGQRVIVDGKETAIDGYQFCGLLFSSNSQHLAYWLKKQEHGKCVVDDFEFRFRDHILAEFGVNKNGLFYSIMVNQRQNTATEEIADLFSLSIGRRFEVTRLEVVQSAGTRRTEGDKSGNCPNCGFAYRWDGVACSHCGYTARG